MTSQKDQDKSLKADTDEAGTERELSDDDLDAVAGGATTTLSVNRNKLAAGLLLPAVQKIGDGSV